MLEVAASIVIVFWGTLILPVTLGWWLDHRCDKSPKDSNTKR